MIMEILITGGCGFIGSNFIRYLLKNRDDAKVINIDDLTYAGNLANLIDVQRNYPERYAFVKGDIADKEIIEDIFRKSDISCVVNFAAESHVDRSIIDPELFVRTNILGTFNLLETARNSWPSQDPEDSRVMRFLHISTDEVYGSLGEAGYFTEQSPYDPSSPYSASKASSDHMVRAYGRTYGLPTIITNCSNNYGPYQFPEKLIPLMLRNAMKGVDLPVYGDGKNVRDWIYVEDHCEALLTVLEKGIPGESYNIGGNCEKQNIEIVHLICDTLDEQLGILNDQPRRNLIRFVTDRPGHDRRYAVNTRKIHHDLGWKPSVSFENGIQRTIEWYLNHAKWIEDILNGTYMDYYQKQYGARLNGHE
jgi:dTDP-glucose 4,6-dehydratase